MGMPTITGGFFGPIRVRVELEEMANTPESRAELRDLLMLMEAIEEERKSPQTKTDPQRERDRIDAERYREVRRRCSRFWFCQFPEAGGSAEMIHTEELDKYADFLRNLSEKIK